MTDSTRKKIIKWFWIVVTFPVLLLVFMILLVWMFADIPSFKDLENPCLLYTSDAADEL